jgi:Kef-type K+ transport system membrane component KefB
MDQETINTLAVIAAVAVLAPLLAEVLRRWRIPGVVLEIGLGILVGPQVLKFAHLNDVVDSFADLGLTFLMFLAGYEIDFDRIRGTPLVRAATGWGMSLVLAFAGAAVMVAGGFALNTLLIGLALTTTALGTLLPMLRDSGALESKFGNYVLAVGTVGEFAPIVAIALLLTSSNPFGTSILLALFVGIALAAALLATRSHVPRVLTVLQKNLHSSAQLPVRVSVLFIVSLVWVASRLGLDVLLGAFAAGIVVHLFSAGNDAKVIQVKLEAIGFGFLIPIFFIVSGMRFDLDALLSEPSNVLRLFLFLGLFLVVRGIPALVLYRHDLPKADLVPLALFSATALPLVVVITTIGLQTNRMLPSNAAALVGAGMLSVLLYPLIGFALRRRSARGATPPDAVVGDQQVLDDADRTDTDELGEMGEALGG